MRILQVLRGMTGGWLLAGVLAGVMPPLAMGADTAMPAADSAKDVLPEVTVWRSPTCGCCGEWITHMREAGFSVRDVIEPAMHDVKTRLGIPAPYASCHTATLGGYLLEGHVPASDVKRLLADAPEGRGLLVPGMPIGSPGMEVPGRVSDAYDVLLLDDVGAVSVFASH